MQHDALECRAAARALVRNQLERTGHSLEFRLEEHLGLIRSRICRFIKKVFQCFEFKKANCKFEREFPVELYGTEDDRELIAQYNSRCEASGLAEVDRNMSRLREAVHEALVHRSHE